MIAIPAITIILTEGPYISESADIACKIARAALKKAQVNIFLYLDAVHIAKEGQHPASFPNIGRAFSELAEMGATIEACPRCAGARGYQPGGHDFMQGIKITSLYRLAEMIKESDKVISLSR
jgi:tRNA 2-thiouridine synthesizing protein D